MSRQPCRHGAAARLRIPGVVSIALMTMLATLSATPGIAARPSPGAETPTLVADGPFGRVAGVASATDTPAPDPDHVPVLDAWARGTTMVIRPTEGTLAPWTAVALAAPSFDPAAPVALGSGDGEAVLELGTTGLFLVRVAGTVRPDGTAIVGSWWWQVAVPDRDLPDEGSGPPPPAILLVSGAADAALEQGSGCYLGTCGDIGRVSPPDRLPTVRTIPGAPLSISLEDGSAMTRWWVSARRTDDAEADEVVLGQAEDTSTTRAWVVAPGAGEWVISVSVGFDRERGHFDGYGRLIVAPSGDE